MKITVTEEDIAKGDPYSAHRCPIARAVRRELDSNDVTVNHVRIKVYNGPFEGEYTPSRAATRFIRKFDFGKPVEPFTFIPRPKI